MKFMIPSLVVAAVVSPSTRASHMKKSSFLCYEDVMTELKEVARHASTFVRSPFDPRLVAPESLVPSNVTLLKDMTVSELPPRGLLSQGGLGESSNQNNLPRLISESDEVRAARIARENSEREAEFAAWRTARVLYESRLKEAVAFNFANKPATPNICTAPKMSVFEEMRAFDRATLRPVVPSATLPVLRPSSVASAVEADLAVLDERWKESVGARRLHISDSDGDSV
ncbi:MAG: hypothetical protein LCH26_00755 [Proteobacteria bacterium]|nr:hypothetical protein [Pseudomonadota bacterium]